MTLKDYLKSKKVVSPLIEGHEKLDTSEVLNLPLTLTEFDIVTTGDNTYSVLHIAEYPDRFMFGGSVMTQLLCDAVQEMGEETVKSQLEQEPIRFKILTKTAKKPNARTGRKQTYNDIVILD